MEVVTQDNVKKILNKTFKGCNVAEMSEGVYKYLNNKQQRAEVERGLNMFKCRIHTGGKTRKRKKKKKRKGTRHRRGGWTSELANLATLVGAAVGYFLVYQTQQADIQARARQQRIAREETRREEARLEETRREEARLEETRQENTTTGRTGRRYQTRPIPPFGRPN
jgi:uncharacterized protein HemX